MIAARPIKETIRATMFFISAEEDARSWERDGRAFLLGG